MTVSLAERNEVGAICSYFIANAALIDYDSIRPMPTAKLTLPEIKELFKAKKHITMDCSESVVTTFRLAGLGDPTGRNFDGEGDTQDMLNRLPHFTDVNRAHEGCIPVFGGPLVIQHACIVMAHNKTNPWLFSHGSEVGPLHVQLSNEKPAHPGQPLTFLDISKLK